MTSDPASLAELIGTLQELKRVRRTGWIDRGVPIEAVESVADHTCLTALIAWTLALDEPGLDAGHVLRLALIHDIAESIVGDEPPYEPGEVPDPADRPALRAFFSVRHVRSEQNRIAKQAAEREAFDRLARLMGPGAREEIASLWDEYEARSTPEARFVKEVDTLEAFLQAQRYAAGDPDLPLDGFTDMARHEITHPPLVALRDAFLAAGTSATVDLDHRRDDDRTVSRQGGHTG